MWLMVHGVKGSYWFKSVDVEFQGWFWRPNELHGVHVGFSMLFLDDVCVLFLSICRSSYHQFLGRDMDIMWGFIEGAIVLLGHQKKSDRTPEMLSSIRYLDFI